MFENFTQPNLMPALPEIFLALMALLILLLDLLIKRGKRTVIFVLTQLTLVGCCLLQMLPNSKEALLTFSNMFVDNLMTDLLKLLVCLTVIVVHAYSRAYILERENMSRGEYYVLSLFATLGMMVMISANHFVTIFLGVELLSLALYVMVAMDRDNAIASEAAMKFFVLGALASGLLLYGMSMLYGATHSLEITAMAARMTSSIDPVVLAFGLVFVIAGLAFKLGVVPFHMWIPDVYQGAPTPVTLFIGSAPKLAAFAVLMNLLVNGLLVKAADWQSMLMVLSVLSMALGNIAAIAQTNIKRMLAYSAIAHMGFMLLGIATAGAGPVEGFEAFLALNAYSSSMFYVITYVLMSAGAFGVILLLSQAGFEADQLDDFKGLNRRSPWLAAVMLAMMFSMAGIPFFVGFFAKFSVLQAVVFSGRYWLALLAVIFSVIGAFYYLRVVKLMYFDAPAAEAAPIKPSLPVKSLLIINGLAVALFGIFPNWLMMVCLTALGVSLRIS